MGYKVASVFLHVLMSQQGKEKETIHSVSPYVPNSNQRNNKRTKAKKKAEIEARKDAIRTEDIAKGVFIPVSSLPQREPQKGAKTT